MARLCKSAGLLTKLRQTQAETAAPGGSGEKTARRRRGTEAAGVFLADQKKVFRSIVKMLKTSDILG